jgi:hypothetical protein
MIAHQATLHLGSDTIDRMSVPEARVGLNDLIQMLDRRRRACVVLAVDAKPGMVSGAIADDFGPPTYIEDAGIRREQENEQDLKHFSAEPWACLIKLNDQPFTLVYYRLFQSGANLIHVLPLEAQEISEALGTRALLLSFDGEEGAIAYQLFSDGKLTEHAVGRADLPLEHFQSARSKNKADGDITRLLDRLLGELRIYIPACYPAGEGEQAWVASVDLDPPSFERVDLWTLPTLKSLPHEVDDDETVVLSADKLEMVLAAGATENKKSAGGLFGLISRFFGQR